MNHYSYHLPFYHPLGVKGLILLPTIMTNELFLITVTIHFQAEK